MSDPDDYSSSSSSSGLDSPPGSPTAGIGLEVHTTPAAPATVNATHIQSRVPVVLDSDATNYRPWCRYFIALFGQHGLGDHIDGSPAKGDSDWVQNDFAIVGWIYNRTSPKLLRTVSGKRDTAYSLWRNIRKTFRENKETKAVYLGTAFRNFKQGDLSVDDYCSSLKEKADVLADLDAPVTEKELVHTLIHGLNPRLWNLIPHMTQRRRLPKFAKARSMLLLQEEQQAEQARTQAAEALVAHTQAGAPPPPSTPGATSSGQSGSSTSTNPRPASIDQKRTNGGKKKKKGAPSAPSYPAVGAARPPAPVLPFYPTFNPWTGMVQPWPLPPASSPARPGAGILGAPPRPAQAYTTQQLPGPYMPQVDPQLLAALSQLSLNGNWVMDTGASSHMANDPGYSQQGGDSPM